MPIFLVGVFSFVAFDRPSGWNTFLQFTQLLHFVDKTARKREVFFLNKTDKAIYSVNYANLFGIRKALNISGTQLNWLVGGKDISRILKIQQCWLDRSCVHCMYCRTGEEIYLTNTQGYFFGQYLPCILSHRSISRPASDRGCYMLVPDIRWALLSHLSMVYTVFWGVCVLTFCS